MIDPTQSSGGAYPTPAPRTVADATKNIANQNVFLQLLVAQLKHQDPSSPQDGTAFVAQLAQFSELSNSTQMTSDIAAIRQALTKAEATS